MTTDSTELYYAEMESARNDIEDAYFSARPSLSEVTPSQRELLQALFRAGFERGFRAAYGLRPASSEETRAAVSDEGSLHAS